MPIKSKGKVVTNSTAKQPAKTAEDSSAKLVSALEAKVASLESKLVAMEKAMKDHEKDSESAHAELRSMCEECCKVSSSPGSDADLIEQLKLYFETANSRKTATIWPKL